MSGVLLPIPFGHRLAIGPQPEDVCGGGPFHSALKELLAAKDWMAFAQGNDCARKSQEISIFGLKLPVEPGNFTILAVGIIVPLLSVAYGVAAQQHRYPLGDQQCREQIALLPRP